MRYLLICCALMAIGCGGSGGGSGSPLEGNYTGTWGGVFGQIPPPGDSGTLNLTVSESGVVTGSCLNSGSSETGTVTGTIKANGDVQMDVDYPVRPDVEIYGNLEPDLSGDRLFFATEEFSRTIHVYLTAVNLERQ